MDSDPFTPAVRKEYEDNRKYQEQAEIQAADKFMFATQAMTVADAVSGVSDVSDYIGGEWTKRPRRLGDMMYESLEYANGPMFNDLFQVLIDAANGKAVQAQAEDLVKRMAWKWAEHYAEEV